MEQLGSFEHHAASKSLIFLEKAIERLAARGEDVTNERRELEAVQNRLAALTKKEKDYHLIQDFMFGIFKK
ncbi:hypothetical protein [Zooshikella ganghwensis]|uniref:Uncharacterized protein n=1 Tax=Zooshikella ganghwensis TaxID=202772 RepID=A0A4P9VGZ5_9GAMM|nr:hypothetical protein [Zooshikella ganghwensis]RDH41716.1 hypothetical protein B9G39_27030 [Zooshikella ganghwensis]